MIAFAAIAPHGDVDLAPELRAAMEELGRRSERAQLDTVVVVTPHSVHVEGHLAVVTAARVGPHETDRELALAILRALREDGLPAVAVSYGGNDPAEAELPLDWGTEVPLDFVRAPRIVVVSPARDVRMDDHVRAGTAIARAASQTSNSLLQGKRVGLVASADHGHAHDPDGPYGFDPAATAYDTHLREILSRDSSTSRRSVSSSMRRRPTRSGSCSSSRARSGRTPARTSSPTRRRPTTACSARR